MDFSQKAMRQSWPKGICDYCGDNVDPDCLDIPTCCSSAVLDIITACNNRIAELEAEVKSLQWTKEHCQRLRNAICDAIPDGEPYGDDALEAYPSKLTAENERLRKELAACKLARQAGHCKPNAERHDTKPTLADGHERDCRGGR